MQPRSYATIGAWTLGTSGSEVAVDARMSFELMGTKSRVETSIAPLTGPLPEHPVDAARRWLAEPSRRARLGPALVARAEASVLVAERWFHEIDALANEFAATAIVDGSGELSTEDLDRLDDMIGVVTTYAVKLRELLDPESPATDANDRMNAALEASRSGGLPALVDALCA